MEGTSIQRFSRETNMQILCKPMDETNQRLTSGLYACYQRGEKCSLFLAAAQWNHDFPSLFSLFEQGMSGNKGVDVQPMDDQLRFMELDQLIRNKREIKESFVHAVQNTDADVVL